MNGKAGLVMAAVNKVINVLGAILLFVLMMLTVVDVFGRSVLNKPLPGAGEITEIVLAGIVFFLLPRVTFRRQHIAVDIVGRKAEGWLRAVLDVIAAVAGGVMFTLIGWRLGHLGVNAGSYNDVTATLEFPLAPVLYVIAALSVVTALAFLATIPEALRQAGRTDATAPADTDARS